MIGYAQIRKDQSFDFLLTENIKRGNCKILLYNSNITFNEYMYIFVILSQFLSLIHINFIFVYLFLLTIRWIIITYCFRYPRRYIYNAFCISMILNIKCKTHITYIMQLFAINIIQYHFVCGKCGVILTRKNNVEGVFIL